MVQLLGLLNNVGGLNSVCSRFFCGYETLLCKFRIPKFYAIISRHIPLVEGRFEMLRYLREQSLSIDYHRYVNLGEREF